MIPGNQTRVGQSAAVQVWGKGFRVTVDNEEFQRYVPVNLEAEGLEKRLAAMRWGKVLEPLYSLSERELSSQRCVLFDESSLMALSFSHTEDRHRRPSLLLATATARIHWTSGNIADTAARTVALATRLAGAYSATMRGNPDPIGAQLRGNAFLPSRTFDLADETPDQGVEWEDAIAAVKAWRGVTGLFTPRLGNLGANVLLGTMYEAERVRLQFEVDGYFDVRERAIKPLTPRLAPWVQPPPPAPPAIPAQEIPPLLHDLNPVVESLGRIERTLERLADVGARLVDLGVRVVEQAIRDKRKK